MFADMIDKYFENRENITAVVVLLDARRGVTEDDQAIIDYLMQKGHRFVTIGTKLDKVNQSQQHQFKKQTLAALHNEPVIYSALTKKNLDKVVGILEGLIE